VLGLRPPQPPLPLLPPIRWSMFIYTRVKSSDVAVDALLFAKDGNNLTGDTGGTILRVLRLDVFCL